MSILTKPPGAIISNRQIKELIPSGDKITKLYLCPWHDNSINIVWLTRYSFMKGKWVHQLRSETDGIYFDNMILIGRPPKVVSAILGPPWWSLDRKNQKPFVFTNYWHAYAHQMHLLRAQESK